MVWTVAGCELVLSRTATQWGAELIGNKKCFRCGVWCELWRGCELVHIAAPLRSGRGRNYSELLENFRCGFSKQKSN